MIQRSFAGHVYLRDQSIEEMRDILQSRFLRSNVPHKQLARTSLKSRENVLFLRLIPISKKVHLQQLQEMQGFPFVKRRHTMGTFFVKNGI